MEKDSQPKALLKMIRSFLQGRILLVSHGRYPTSNLQTPNIHNFYYLEEHSMIRLWLITIVIVFRPLTIGFIPLAKGLFRAAIKWGVILTTMQTYNPHLGV